MIRQRTLKEDEMNVVRIAMFSAVVFVLAGVVAFAGGSDESVAAGRFDGAVVDALIFKSSDTDYMIEVLAPRLREETGIELRIDQVPYEEVRAKQLTDASGARRYDIVNTTTEWS